MFRFMYDKRLKVHQCWWIRKVPWLEDIFERQEWGAILGMEYPHHFSSHEHVDLTRQLQLHDESITLITTDCWKILAIHTHWRLEKQELCYKRKTTFEDGMDCWVFHSPYKLCATISSIGTYARRLITGRSFKQSPKYLSEVYKCHEEGYNLPQIIFFIMPVAIHQNMWCNKWL